MSKSDSSYLAPARRNTIHTIIQQKGAVPLVAITAYSAPMASLFDAHSDILLVGDSLGMVVYGFDSTLPVTLDMMIAHGAAVVRGSSRALVVVDMPFGSYQHSPEQAFENASRLIRETGASAVKLEGGSVMAPTVRFLTERGIAVMGHVGLLPQSVHAQGGYKAQGKTEDAAARILEDAKALEDAGAFSVVIEGVMEPLAVRITKALTIPTIGIGASAACDGQVLVADDMLGITKHTAKFVKQFGTLAQHIDDAMAAYANAVRARNFPSSEHTYLKKS